MLPINAKKCPYLSLIDPNGRLNRQT